MKKIFTLLCVLCGVLSANAEKVLENVTWGAWSDACTVDGNTLTFSEAWAGAGFDARTEVISETDTTYLMADWSDYDYLVFEISNAVGSYNICVQYTENYDPSSNGSTGVNGYGAVGLNADYSDQVAQAWIQSTAPGSVTIDRLILMDADEFEAYKESKKPQGDKVNIWTGEQTFDGGWPAITLGAASFEDAEAGDLIEVVVSSIDPSINPNWEWGSQIFFKNGDWSDLTEEMKLESIAEIGAYTFALSETNLAIAKTNGLVLQGMCVIVTELNLMKAGPASNAIWEGEQKFDSNWPSISLAASNFQDSNVGDKIIVTLTVDDSINPNWTYGAQIFFKKGDWSGDPDDAMFASTSESGDYEFELTEANLATAKSVGLILQGMNVLVTKVALQAASSSIENVTDTPAAMTGKLYNLSGVQVDASYNGIVIMNGKKYLNK